MDTATTPMPGMVVVVVTVVAVMATMTILFFVCFCSKIDGFEFCHQACSIVSLVISSTEEGLPHLVGSVLLEHSSLTK